MKTLPLLIALFLPYAAFATVTGVSVNPTTREASVSGNSTFVVTWQVTHTPFAGTGTMIGQAGTFKIAGAPTTATTRTITRSIPNGLVGVVNIVENVTVPRHVVLAAQRQGAVLEYERFFADDGVFANSDEVTITITGGTAGQPGLASQTLTFEDGTDYRAIAQKEALRARAEVNVSGSGVLRAVWEVADNFGGLDQPLYRPLKNVTRPVGANNQLTLVSPELPTGTLGRYRVRLRMLAPATDETLPTIDYFVTETGDGAYEKPFEPKISAKKGGGLK